MLLLLGMRSTMVVVTAAVFLVLVVLSAAAGANAVAAPSGVTIQARMFNRDSAQLDADVLAQGDKPTIGVCSTMGCWQTS